MIPGLTSPPLSCPPQVYSVPPCRTNAAPQEGNYDFPQPLKHKQEGVYDVPPSAHSSQSHYDFPPSPSVESPAQRQHPNGTEGIYDIPPSALNSGPDSQLDVYDFPRGSQPPQVSTSAADRDGIYDVPAQDTRAVADVTDGVNRLSISSTGSSRSSMSTSSSSAGSGAEGRLVLDVDAALQRLYRLQQALELTVGALHSMTASPHWRTFPFMERHANNVRTVLHRVRTAVVDFVAFGKGAAANATSLSDTSLHSKLRRQLGRLEDSQQILLQTYQALENCSWALNALTSSRQHHNKSDDLDRFVMVSRTVPDDAKQLTSTIGSNVDLLFRRTDGSSPEEHPLHPLTSPPSENDNFRGQTKTFPASPGQDKDNMNNSEKCVKSWMEDYDYVHLQVEHHLFLHVDHQSKAVTMEPEELSSPFPRSSQGKEDFERQQKELLEKEDIIKQNHVQLGQEQVPLPLQTLFRLLSIEKQMFNKFCFPQINQFKKLEQEVIKPVENDVPQWITASTSDPSSAHVCSRDRQLLAFYSTQCEQHFVTLLSAVDAFFGCIRAGQPPRIFVAHSKFVILSAHKLVFIGDTLSRQASAPEVANRVMNSSNVLCDLLKTVVTATKTAALNYQNTAAIQEMVDRVTELSHRAQHFKEQLLQMSSL